MTYQDFAYELNRLDAIKIPKTEQDISERKALEAELWRKYSWMLPPQWNATVSWVIDKHKTKGLPTMPEFGAAVGMMRDKGIIKTEACRSCNGTKMQYIRVRHVPTSREFDASKPCSVCMVGAQWELKKDLEVLSEGGGNSSPLRMAHAMSPQGAYWALHRGNSLNVKWDPDVLEVLVTKAGQYELEIEQKKAKQPPPAHKAPELMREQIEALAPVDGSPAPIIVNGEEYEIED